MFHFHRFGPVKDGYQYCVKCQKAFPVQHTCLWEQVDSLTFETRTEPTPAFPNGRSRITAEVRILKCHICGDLKEFRVHI
jgi:hypothetical protein